MWKIKLLTTSTLKFRKLFYLILKKKILFNFSFLIGKRVKFWFEIYKKEKRQYIINQINTECFNLEYSLYILEYFSEYKNIKNIIFTVIYNTNYFLTEFDSFNFFFKNFFKFKYELYLDIVAILEQNSLSCFNFFTFYNYNFFKTI